MNKEKMELIEERVCEHCGEPLKEDEVDICDECREFDKERREAFKDCNRKSVFIDLKQYKSIYAQKGEYVEVSRWANDEGFDITFKDAITDHIMRISIDYDQMTALLNAFNMLGVDVEKELLLQ